MSRLLIRLALFGLLGAALAACTQPARTNAMIADVTDTTILKPDSPLKNAISVAAVSGGEETNPLWISKVGNAEFREALTLSLQQHTMLTTDVGGMPLMVTLEKLDQPIVGFDLEVTATVRYVVTRDNAVVYDETVTHAHTQDFSSAPLAYKRLQLANEGAIRNNIAIFIQNLVNAARANPQRFGALPATS